MFSGIISHIGEVTDIASGEQSWRVSITSDLPSDSIGEGASIACNGVCLSVVESRPPIFTIEAGLTTRDKTTLGSWQRGKRVNLEESLLLGGKLEGHIVTGHIDACCRLRERAICENEVRLTFAFPEDSDELRTLVARHGSVALDGVSLTVSECRTDFTVALFPYTAKKTTLGDLGEGEYANVEADILARYIARRLSVHRLSVHA